MPTNSQEKQLFISIWILLLIGIGLYYSGSLFKSHYETPALIYSPTISHIFDEQRRMITQKEKTITVHMTKKPEYHQSIPSFETLLFVTYELRNTQRSLEKKKIPLLLHQEQNHVSFSFEKQTKNKVTQVFVDISR